MSEPYIAGLYCYPVKSCGGIALEVAHIVETGIRYDRRWMIVDQNGQCLTQREEVKCGRRIHSLCRIKTRFVDNDQLELAAPGMPPLYVPLAGDPAGKAYVVQIWGRQCVAYDQGEKARCWLTEFLSREEPGNYQLVRAPSDMRRRSSDGAFRITFADTAPLLVLSLASLKDLNDRLTKNGEPQVSAERFRPNIVLDGCEAHEEDVFSTLKLDKLVLYGTARCSACTITTVSALSGGRGREPLKTLAEYRQRDGNIVFGRYFIPHGTTYAVVGDKLIAEQELVAE